ncbi:MAG: hypothetical protein KJ052_10000, partial [Candidatus Hydrogenedentes bacterium]|nr:hypothetical protein [Candidatus Hydrogenedentota bacterium]
MNQRLQQLQQFPLPPSAVAFRTQDELADHLKSLEGVQWRPIGASREGWTLYGYKFGVGRNRVSIVAGSHADEPAGPMTAQMLPLILAQSFPDVMETYTFRVVPQINPDGAE